MTNDIYEMLNQAVKEKDDLPARLPKEEYAKMMNEKRENLYKVAELQSFIVAGTPKSYLQYLNLQSKLDYTVTNTLLIMSQKPNATFLKDSSHWRQDKHYIKKDENGIKILEPSGEYLKKDGTMGTNYKIKSVFDISQVNGNVKLPADSKITTRTLLSALIYDTPIKLQVVDPTQNNNSEPVMYSSELKSIIYENSLDANTLLQGLAREFCYVELDKQYGEIDRDRDGFIAESASYILCKKYGIPISDVAFADKVTDYFADMDSKDIKEELGNIKSLYEDVSKRMERGIYKIQNREVTEQQKQDIGR